MPDREPTEAMRHLSEVLDAQLKDGLQAYLEKLKQEQWSEHSEPRHPDNTE